MTNKAKTKRTIKIKLSKTKQVQLTMKTNIVLPRGIKALCNHSLLKKTLKTSENVLLKFLELMVDGVELMYAAQSHQSLLIRQGLEGVRRYKLEEEMYLQQRLLRQLKRQKLIEARTIGDRVIYNLTAHGKTKFLKAQIRAINKQSDGIKPRCIVIFDVPESEKVARNTFRKFLRECGFAKLQHSVWCANAAVLPHLMRLINELEIKKWVKIIEAKNVY